MLPAIVLLAMLAWRAQLESAINHLVGEWAVGMVTLVSIFWLMHLVLRGRWKQLAICMVVCVVAGTLLMMGAGAIIPLNFHGLTGYWTIYNWSAAVLAIAFQLVLPAAAVFGLILANAIRLSKLGRATRPRQILNPDTFHQAGKA